MLQIAVPAVYLQEVLTTYSALYLVCATEL